MPQNTYRIYQRLALVWWLHPLPKNQFNILSGAFRIYESNSEHDRVFRLSRAFQLCYIIVAIIPILSRKFV